MSSVKILNHDDTTNTTTGKTHLRVVTVVAVVVEFPAQRQASHSSPICYSDRMQLRVLPETLALLPQFFPQRDDDELPLDDFILKPPPPVSPDAPIILVVDDDLANLALAEALLQAEGFQVRVAIDAPSTFKVLKTVTPALILMDIQLPEMDGWELTRKLKADPATREIPVIAITAYGKTGDEKKAKQAGFVEFLAKPVSTRDLPGIVRRHLSTPGR
jgi:two-component system, cell cycle response regulator DivK